MGPANRSASPLSAGSSTASSTDGLVGDATRSAKKQPVAAFFDVDLTLLQVSSGSQWISYLRRRGSGSWHDAQGPRSGRCKYKLAFLDMEPSGVVSSPTSRGHRNRHAAEVQAFFRDILLRRPPPYQGGRLASTAGACAGALTSARHVARPWPELGIVTCCALDCS